MAASSSDGDRAAQSLLNLCVVTNGERRPIRVSSGASALDVKAQLALGDGFEDAAMLFGALLFRGKKLDDAAPLDASGVQDRDKLMVSYAPGVKDIIAQLRTIRVDVLALEDQRRAGAQVHTDLVTTQMLRLDGIDLGALPDPAREVVRVIRKGELKRLAQIETGGGATGGAVPA